MERIYTLPDEMVPLLGVSGSCTLICHWSGSVNDCPPPDLDGFVHALLGDRLDWHDPSASGVPEWIHGLSFEVHGIGDVVWIDGASSLALWLALPGVLRSLIRLGLWSFPPPDPSRPRFSYGAWSMLLAPGLGMSREMVRRRAECFKILVSLPSASPRKIYGLCIDRAFSDPQIGEFVRLFHAAGVSWWLSDPLDNTQGLCDLLACESSPSLPFHVLSVEPPPSLGGSIMGGLWDRFMMSLSFGSPRSPWRILGPSPDGQLPVEDMIISLYGMLRDLSGTDLQVPSLVSQFRRSQDADPLGKYLIAVLIGHMLEDRYADFPRDDLEAFVDVLDPPAFSPTGIPGSLPAPDKSFVFTPSAGMAPVPSSNFLDGSRQVARRLRARLLRERVDESHPVSTSRESLPPVLRDPEVRRPSGLLRVAPSHGSGPAAEETSADHDSGQ